MFPPHAIKPACVLSPFHFRRLFIPMQTTFQKFSAKGVSSSTTAAFTSPKHSQAFPSHCVPLLSSSAGKFIFVAFALASSIPHAAPASCENLTTPILRTKVLSSGQTDAGSAGEQPARDNRCGGQRRWPKTLAPPL